MVFPSIPVYLDPPHWHQQPNQHEANGIDNLEVQVFPAEGEGEGEAGAGSMVRPDAKVAAPEVAKCPRCESTNTKFCYYNNYSLSQPRHFCKTCRRYWTKGGALRNVPVGGGCRRNNKKSKRSSRSRSKSPASNYSTDDQKQDTISSTEQLIGQFPQPTNQSFMASLQNLSRYGLSLSEIQGHTHPIPVGFQMGGGVGGVDQWRFHQLPLLNGFESTSSAVSSFPFQSGRVIEAASSHGLFGDTAGDHNTDQLPRFKLEDKQYYSWTGLSGLASSFH